MSILRRKVKIKEPDNADDLTPDEKRDLDRSLLDAREGRVQPMPGYPYPEVHFNYDTHLAEIHCPKCGGYWHDPDNNVSREELCNKCKEDEKMQNQPPEATRIPPYVPPVQEGVEMNKDEEESEPETEEEPSESDEQEQETAEADAEDAEEGGEEEGENEEAEPEPIKYILRKLVSKTFLDKSRHPFKKPIFINLPDGEFFGRIPSKDDIESMFFPLYGGGEYLVINTKTKGCTKKYEFDGVPKDPDEGEAIVLDEKPQSEAPATQPTTTQTQTLTAIDKVTMAMSSGTNKAVEEIATLLDKTTDPIERKFLMESLREIATGKSTASPQDRLMEILLSDRKSSQEMMMQMLMKDKRGPDPMEVVNNTIGSMTAMMGLAKEMNPGADTTLELAKEVTGAVKDGMRDVTDTIVKISGSGPLKPKEDGKFEKPEVEYKCGQCGATVQPTYKSCPQCGMLFRPKAVPPNAPNAPAVPQAPPLPKEVKEKIGYLRSLAVFIQEKHDPEVKGSAVFNWAGYEQKKQLLFTAEFGYANLMKLAEPYRESPEIPEAKSIFAIIDSPEGRYWINSFFKSIEKTAEDLNFVLTEDDKEVFTEILNKHSRVKFHYKKKVPPPAPPVVPADQYPEVRNPEKQVDDGMTTCPICDDGVPIARKDLKRHLFNSHPDERPAKAKVKDAKKAATKTKTAPKPVMTSLNPPSKPKKLNDLLEGNGEELAEGP